MVRSFPRMHGAPTHFSCHPLPPCMPYHPFSLPECKPRFRQTGVMAPERPGRHPEETAANRTGGPPAVNGTAECAEKAISTVPTEFCRLQMQDYRNLTGIWSPVSWIVKLMPRPNSFLPPFLRTKAPTPRYHEPILWYTLYSWISSLPSSREKRHLPLKAQASEKRWRMRRSS